MHGIATAIQVEPSRELVGYFAALDFLADVRAGQFVSLCHIGGITLAGKPNDLGQLWLSNAERHLHDSLNRYLRAGHVPITSEQMVLALLKKAADELVAAGDALEAAAQVLKSAGKYQCNQAHQASLRAYEQAEGLVTR